jgi:hypothetical protein
MGVVIHRITKEVQRSVDINAFSGVDWVRYARPVAGDSAKLAAFEALAVPSRYIKFDGSDNPSEMTVAEKLVVDNTEVKLEIVSAAGLDTDGVPVVLADGIATHVVTVTKKNLAGTVLVSGTEIVRIFTSIPITRPASVTLVAGTLTFAVGPVALGVRGDLTVFVTDNAGVLKKSSDLKLRFR